MTAVSATVVEDLLGAGISRGMVLVYDLRRIVEELVAKVSESGLSAVDADM